MRHFENIKHKREHTYWMFQVSELRKLLLQLWFWLDLHRRRKSKGIYGLGYSAFIISANILPPRSKPQVLMTINIFKTFAYFNILFGASLTGM